MITKPKDFVDAVTFYASLPSPAAKVQQVLACETLFAKADVAERKQVAAYAKHEHLSSYKYMVSGGFWAGAACFSAAYKPVDLLIGTGRQRSPLPATISRDELHTYLRRSIATASDTGALGASLGLKFAVVAGTGAALGAVVGALLGTAAHLLHERKGSSLQQRIVSHVNSGEADGAFIFTAMWLNAAPMGLLALGILRLISGLAKGAGACLLGAATAVVMGVVVAPTVLALSAVPWAHGKINTFNQHNLAAMQGTRRVFNQLLSI